MSEETKRRSTSIEEILERRDIAAAMNFSSEVGREGSTGSCLTGRVLKCLLALHRGDSRALLNDIHTARYCVDRPDIDTFFSHHLVSEAMNLRYLSEFGSLFESAAAQIRDELRGDGDPALSRLIWGTLALERRLELGQVTFEKIVNTWLGALVLWAVGRSDDKVDHIFEAMVVEARLTEEAELLALKRFAEQAHVPGRSIADPSFPVRPPAVGEQVRLRSLSLPGQ